jgi:hypothetical protein
LDATNSRMRLAPARFVESPARRAVWRAENPAILAFSIAPVLRKILSGRWNELTTTVVASCSRTGCFTFRSAACGCWLDCAELRIKSRTDGHADAVTTHVMDEYCVLSPIAIRDR